MKAALVLLALLPNAPTDVRVTMGACGQAPALPAVTEAWAVQVSDTEWQTYVTAWVRGTDTCWELGREVLEYHNDAQTPQVHESTGIEEEPVYEP